MGLVWLDHVNIRTANLEAMVRFYRDVLGLELGARPPFSFAGAWLYCGDKAAVHLVQRGPASTSPATAGAAESKIEHFAFRAEGLEQFIERLKIHGVEYRLAVVPKIELRQLHIHDPDGNHIEVSFAPDGATSDADQVSRQP